VARLSGLFVLGAIIALIVAVLPAFGAAVDKVEVPLGGQSDDCSALVALEDPDEPGVFPYAHLGALDLVDFRVENPQNDTFTDPVTGADFTLTGLVGGGKSFTWSTAHLVHAIVVKGGAKSVLYDYTIIGGGQGPLSGDNNLEGPDKKNPEGPTFNVSHVSFCYELVVADISGTVFHDHDQDGVQDDGTDDPDSTKNPVEDGLGGWTVTVYDSNGNVVATTSTGDAPGTAAHGTYLFQDLNAGQTYTVCQADPNGGQWGQTDVGGTWSTSACGSGSEEDGGHVILLEADATANFGNFLTVTAGCGSTVTLGGNTITFPAANGLCDKSTEEYVIEIYIRGTGANAEQVVDFHPIDGSTSGNAHLTEVLVWDIDQNPDPGSVLKYDDGKGEAIALYCNHDPRPLTAASVIGLLPTGGTPPTGGHTTCIIESTEGPNAAGNDIRTDVLYSFLDGRRFV
jgi:hypothetical protein